MKDYDVVQIVELQKLQQNWKQACNFQSGTDRTGIATLNCPKRIGRLRSFTWDGNVKADQK